MRRSILSGSVNCSSRINDLNSPVANSSVLEVASGCRNRLFGVISTAGFLFSWRACRLNRWKYWAGVVTFMTWILSSAQSCRKRSRRPEECSGPWPSYPCGRFSIIADFCPHLASLEAINWSIGICAPLAKSPNWASQITRASSLVAL